MSSRYQAAVDHRHDALRFLTDRPDRAIELLSTVSGIDNNGDQFTKKDDIVITQKLLVGLTKLLEGADTYFWSDDITKLMVAAGSSLPEDTVFHKSMLPSAWGFSWLEYHIPLPDPPMIDPDIGELNTSLELAAISWQPISNGDMILSTWVLAKNKTTGKPIGPGYYNVIYPYLVMTLGDGGTIADTLVHVDYDLNPDVPISIKVFLSMLAFLDQQLLEVAEGYPDRASKRRMERDPRTKDIAHSPIQVITLRRPRHAKAYDEMVDTKHVEWSYQWLVRGHWRDQPYPASNSVKRIWISGYTKGPDDKPLLIREKVLAVVR